MTADFIYVRKFPEGYKIGYVPSYCNDLSKAFDGSKVFFHKKSAMKAAQRLMYKYRKNMVPIEGGVLYIGDAELKCALAISALLRYQ